MNISAEGQPPGYGRIFSLAWPIMLANCSVPILGLVDTAVIGHTSDARALAAIALGALIFNFIYWGCGFLRMGTTGLTAQAVGEGDEPEVRATLMRGLLIATGLGLFAILAQSGIIWFSLGVLSADVGAESLAAQYLGIRIWGAPASLAMYAVMGAFIGLGRSDLLLKVQLFLNSLNILLDLLFAGVFAWGVSGIALGTAIAEWSALILALSLAVRLFRQRHTDQASFLEWPRILRKQALRRSFTVNRDIFLRTLFLLFGFAWFTNEAAQYGNVMLAANHVLIQFITFSAYLLDGYANATEPLVGNAVGARNKALFDTVVRRSVSLAGFTAITLSAVILLGGSFGIQALTDIPEVRLAAEAFLPYCVAYVLCAFAAFQLDGIFIGATQTQAMRNASFISLLAFLLAWFVLTRIWGNHGLWMAMIIFVVARALALMCFYPGLRARLVPVPER